MSGWDHGRPADAPCPSSETGDEVLRFCRGGGVIPSPDMANQKHSKLLLVEAGIFCLPKETYFGEPRQPLLFFSISPLFDVPANRQAPSRIEMCTGPPPCKWNLPRPHESGGWSATKRSFIYFPTHRPPHWRAFSGPDIWRKIGPKRAGAPPFPWNSSPYRASPSPSRGAKTNRARKPGGET